jgi:hypothetical protein
VEAGDAAGRAGRGSCNGSTALKSPVTGQTGIGGGAVGGPDSGVGRQEAKWQARTIDPGMESVKAAAVAGEGKAVTSIRSRSEVNCGVPPGADPIAREIPQSGSRKAIRSMLSIAMFSAGHAGGV